jgi:ribosome biogenesis protein UTP30
MAGKLAPPINTKLVERAVDALLNHVERNKKMGGKEQLLDDADPISVLIGMKSIPSTNGRTKPHLITLKHPLMDPDETEVCLIVKDPQREFKDKIEAKGIKAVKKVIGVSKLRSKFKQYEAKRQLCASYDLFLADDRVLPMLPHLIGKVFFEKKKQPLPVKLTRDNWDSQFQKIFNATPFYLSEGMCSTVKAGHTGMSRQHLVENIVSALDLVAELLPKKWQGIQAIHIKTHDSIALPIYHSLPGALVIEPPAQRDKGEKSLGKRKASESSGGEESDGEEKQVSAKRRRFEKRAEARKAGKAAKNAASKTDAKASGLKKAAKPLGKGGKTDKPATAAPPVAVKAETSAIKTEIAAPAKAKPGKAEAPVAAVKAEKAPAKGKPAKAAPAHAKAAPALAIKSIKSETAAPAKGKPAKGKPAEAAVAIKTETAPGKSKQTAKKAKSTLAAEGKKAVRAQ